MDKFTEKVLTQEDYDPINLPMLKDYLTKSFGDILSKVNKSF